MVIIPDPRWVDDGEDGEHSPRLIHGAVYCGTCGYHLNMLPKQGRCPECGEPYDARDHRREGVFSLTEVEFPYLDVAASLTSGLMLIWLISGMIQKPEVWTGLFTVLMGIVTPLFVRQTWKRVKGYLQLLRLERQIDQEYGWEEDF